MTKDISKKKKKEDVLRTIVITILITLATIILIISAAIIGNIDFNEKDNQCKEIGMRYVYSGNFCEEPAFGYFVCYKSNVVDGFIKGYDCKALKEGEINDDENN